MSSSDTPPFWSSRSFFTSSPFARTVHVPFGSGNTKLRPHIIPPLTFKLPPVLTIISPPLNDTHNDPPAPNPPEVLFFGTSSSTAALYGSVLDVGRFVGGIAMCSFAICALPAITLKGVGVDTEGEDCPVVKLGDVENTVASAFITLGFVMCTELIMFALKAKSTIFFEEFEEEQGAVAAGGGDVQGAVGAVAQVAVEVVEQVTGERGERGERGEPSGGSGGGAVGGGAGGAGERGE